MGDLEDGVPALPTSALGMTPPQQNMKRSFVHSRSHLARVFHHALTKGSHGRVRHLASAIYDGGDMHALRKMLEEAAEHETTMTQQNSTIWDYKTGKKRSWFEYYSADLVSRAHVLMMLCVRTYRLFNISSSISRLRLSGSQGNQQRNYKALSVAC